MMILHRRDIPLLGFFNCCEKCNLEKKILDCGAGGSSPPLAIFHLRGYSTCGIEISDSQIKKANQYAKKNNMELNIIKGECENYLMKMNHLVLLLVTILFFI